MADFYENSKWSKGFEFWSDSPALPYQNRQAVTGGVSYFPFNHYSKVLTVQCSGSTYIEFGPTNNFTDGYCTRLAPGEAVTLAVRLKGIFVNAPGAGSTVQIFAEMTPVPTGSVTYAPEPTITTTGQYGGHAVSGTIR